MAYDSSSDVITVGEIWRRVRDKIGFIVAALVLGALLAVTIVAFLAYKNERPITYYVNLNAIQDLKYPNGSTFSTGDLVSPPVLAQVRRELNLTTDIQLAGNIQVVLDSPTASAITRIYRERLSARTLTATDINSINDAYTEQLKAATAQSARIDVNYVSMGVNEATGKAIAVAVPKVWSDVFTKQFRTLTSQFMVVRLPTTTAEEFRNPAGVLSLNGQLDVMNAGLKAITTDNRLNSVQDGHGNTAEDVVAELKSFVEVYFSPIFASYLGNDSVVSKVYLTSQSLRMAELKSKIAGIDESVTKLQAFQSLSGSVQNTEPTSVAPNIQLDSGALSQVVSLAERASNAQYLQNLLNQRQTATEEIAAIRRRVDLIQTPTDASVGSEFAEVAYSEFNRIKESYNNLAANARTQAEDRSGALYRPLTSAVVEGRLIDTRSIVLAMAIVALMLFVAIAFAVFGRNSEKS